ncbi:hypothetical protein N7373_18515 [Achromobacter mucicolens]|uniref:hypothetical protein n=1 Tax=Achromobacter mucicolens TaxID=1389922 RepID=UPI00244AB52B|nr:hypothetical protein [Achromobacter mucicolens]MDH0093451.1 hypothetical protein [Achromobacter mucicolens]
MNNQIQQTYARTTSSGSGGAQPFFLEQPSMTNNAKPAIAFLRGLKARCQWAVAHLNADEFECIEAQTEAYCEGRFDFDAGRDCEDVPPLLADVADLRRAWLRGWDEACDSQEMASCPYCQDPDVELCPIHD